MVPGKQGQTIQVLPDIMKASEEPGQKSKGAGAGPFPEKLS